MILRKEYNIDIEKLKQMAIESQETLDELLQEKEREKIKFANDETKYVTFNKIQTK